MLESLCLIVVDGISVPSFIHHLKLFL